MKKYILSLFLLLLFSNTIFSTQPHEISSHEKYVAICKLWGFLKYHHPEVVKGKIDWDNKFLTQLEAVDSIHNIEEFQAFSINWIVSIPIKKSNRSSTILTPYKNKIFEKFSSDSLLYGVELLGLIKMILLEENKKSHYVKQNPVGNIRISNENSYKDIIFPSKELRLLALFRFWNLIEYYYPLKDDLDWETVLEKRISLFLSASNVTEYHKAIGVLVSDIKDGHSVISSSVLYKEFFSKTVTFITKYANENLIVTALKNDSLSKLRIGDRIISINGLKISEKLKQIDTIVPSSNLNSIVKGNGNWFFVEFDSTFKVQVVRNGETLNIEIQKYSNDNYSIKYYNSSTRIKRINDSIVYLNPIDIKHTEINKYLESVAEFKTIILDYRGYPKIRYHKFTDFIIGERKYFAIRKTPVANQPNNFKYDTLRVRDSKKCGFTGNLILLVDSYTMSASEFTVMALQSLDNVYVVGTQSAGADGTVTEFIFPGNVKTYYSGVGIYYPNGEIAQRKGVKLDREVEIKVEDVINANDKILEEAIKYSYEL